MALMRRRPGGPGAPSENDPIDAGNAPAVFDTREGLGGAPGPGLGGAPPMTHAPVPKVPDPLTPNDARFGETPRERGGGGPFPVPGQPHEPSPLSATPGGDVMPPSAPMSPFSPMQSGDPNAMFSPAGAGPSRRSLFGSMGGLKGGGLGQPLDPLSNDTSNPIQSLIQSLMQKRQGGGFGSF